MTEYDKYVAAINKIYELANKLKENWNNIDNQSFIEEIENNKQIVISNAKNFSKEQMKLDSQHPVSEVLE